MRFETERFQVGDVMTIKDVMASVPGQLVRAPEKHLIRSLKRSGFSASQIGIALNRIKEEAQYESPLCADLVLPFRRGSAMRQLMVGGRGVNTALAEQVVVQAVLRVAGEGSYIPQRAFLDALTADNRRVAVVAGRGSRDERNWLIEDELESGERPAFSTASAFFRTIEETGRYAAIIAYINNPTGKRSRSTKGVPLFHVTGTVEGNSLDFRRQLYIP